VKVSCLLEVHRVSKGAAYISEDIEDATGGSETGNKVEVINKNHRTCMLSEAKQ
ncbi:hypothetical protein BSL78_00146, partial [Apostichopus japonicus]